MDHGRPDPVAPDEPWRVAEAVRRLGLQHVVITSVARDDLADEGAGHFVEVIRVVRRENPGISVEVLVPDFHARAPLVHQLLHEGRPEVFAHNVETVERLSPLLRPQASFARSLAVLAMAAGAKTGSLIKSSLMVGLGETVEELTCTYEALRAVGVTHLTIGQYLRPDAHHLPVMEYLSPARFRLYEQLAYDAGLVWVTAGPFVRSSYHASQALLRRSDTLASQRRALAALPPIPPAPPDVSAVGEERVSLATSRNI